MATTTKPIQIRRGNEADFDANKMLPAEFAAFLDTKKLHIAFAPGDTKEIAMAEDLEDATDRVEYLEDALEADETTITDNISRIGNLEQRATTHETNINAIDQDIITITQNVTALGNAVNTKVDEAILSEDRKYLVLKANGSVVAELGPFAGEGGGGSGGGSSTVTTMTMTNSSGWLAKTVAEGTSVSISCTWSSTLDEIPTGAGILKVYVDGVVRSTRNVEQGAFTVDVTNYIKSGNNSIRINVTDVYGTTRDIRYTITVAKLTISSPFNPLTPVTDAFTFFYTPTGELTKTVHFLLDGVALANDTVETSGRQQTKAIPAQTHGAHTLEVYFTCEIDGSEVSSNHLWYEFTSVVSGNSTPIITSQFHSATAEQYGTIVIPYQVYSPSSLTSEIQLLVGETVIQTITVDRNEHEWSYRPLNYGALAMKIKCGSVVKTFNITVTQSSASIGAVTEDLSLYLTAQNRSNGETNPATWTYGNISATMTGFNFVKDGWILDGDGASILRVSGDARVTIPYKIFQTDFRSTGKTIELEFATSNVLDYDATILSCTSGDRGLVLTPNKATLKSESSEISVQYKEDEHIRVAFVAEKYSENRLLLAYINGIPSGVIQYAVDDDFSQISPVNISIGSNSCTLDLYCIRIYNNDLTRHQVLGNWIADTQDVTQMLARYDRNNIYDSYGNIVIEKLPNDLPYMIISCDELSQYKGDKKTVTIRYVDPVDTTKSFTAEGVQLNVQGTSSAPYYRKNYDQQYKSGFELTSGHVDNYELSTGAIPFNRFVLKADVASSEGANNVELVKLYNDACPYKTPEMVADNRVRWGIDGYPIVVFWNNTNAGTTGFLGKYNFNLPKRAPAPYGYANDATMESWEFQNNTSNLMLYKTDYFDETMLLDPDSGELKEAWRFDYEARFPDDSWTNYDILQEFQSFVYSTYRDEATGNALASSVEYGGVTYTTDTSAYRLAKFKAEFPTYAELSSFIFYYIFTELFLMIDSRAKNLFIGFNGSPVTVTGRVATRKATAQPYDMDTAIGTNNEGQLVFHYNCEDTDHTSGGASIFNGQDSVLWNNIRDAYDTEIRQMYQQLRSAGIISFNTVEGRYEAHQAKWPEAIWIEDSWFKYLIPLINPDPGKPATGMYLSMMQGSKEQQRKWWLTNRFAYMDSKFNAGDALRQVIQLRGYAKASITVTPYIDLYPTIKYGSNVISQRGTHGQATTLPCPIDALNDTEIYIYSAQHIASIGDVSPLKVGLVDISAAVNLQELKIGDSDSQYDNQNLYELTLGNNNMLKKIDVRNCSGFGDTTMAGHIQTAVDASGCEIIEELYFTGTKIRSLALPNGGNIKKLHLPGTMTNITILNQRNITEFVCPSFANISTMRLENNGSVLNTKSIVQAIPAGTRLRLIGFAWECQNATEIETLLDIFDTMRGLDEQGNNTETAQISGTIHTSSLTGAQIASYNARYPYLTVVADSVASTRSFYSWDGSTLVGTVACANGVPQSTAPSVPARASTAQYSFTQAGWSTDQDSRTANYDHNASTPGDMTYYAAYTATIRQYPITWVSNGSTLRTDTLDYGATPVWGQAMPTKDGQTATAWSPEIAPVTGSATYTAVYLPVYTVTFKNVGGTTLKTQSVVQGQNATPPADPTYDGSDTTGVYVFTGWDKPYTNIQANTTITAQYVDNSSPVIKYLKKTLTDYESDSNTTFASYGLYQQTSLASAKAPAAAVEEYAFSGCSNLALVDLSAASGAVTISANAFQNNAKLESLIIRSSTMATLSNVSAFTGTAIERQDGAVYVPSGLVATYKANANWSNYIIASIDSYPLSTYDTISESWANIESNGGANVNVGDTKSVTFNGVAYKCVCVGKSLDTLKAGGKANTTWVTVPVLETHNMNSTGTTAGGYEATGMRSHIENDWLPNFELKDLVKEVVKVSDTYENGAIVHNGQTTNEKLWLLSAQEVFGGSSYETNGCNYTGFFTSSAKRIKYFSGSAYNWWLRSANSGSNFRYVNNNGNAVRSSASDANGVVLGFCL